MTQQTTFALITGCSGGIVKELAKSFTTRGVTGLATARSVRSLKDLTSQFNNIEAFLLELDDRESFERLKELVTARTNSRLDFLVNNAGAHYAATAMDLELGKAVKL